MNAPVNQAALLPAEMPTITDSAALILQGDAMDRIERFANMMAKGTVSVPKHFTNKPSDCFALCLQAMQWRMNPFAVAQKTFMTPAGALGYEGTLVAAVLSTSGALEGDLRYVYFGDWSKVRGKFEKRESRRNDNSSGEPKYFIVPTYTPADEAGLGIRAIGRLRGEREDREVELFLSQCYPRFSTQWANNPEQQIVYAVDRLWARRHKPSVLLGVYTEDELQDAGPKFMGSADVVGAPPPPPAPPAEPQAYAQTDFDKNLPAWTDVISKGRKTPDALIAMVESKGPKFTDAQKTKLRAINGPTDAAPKTTTAEPADDGPKFTYAELADQIVKATGPEGLDSIKDLARHLPEDQQTGLAKLVQDRAQEIGLTR